MGLSRIFVGDFPKLLRSTRHLSILCHCMVESSFFPVHPMAGVWNPVGVKLDRVFRSEKDSPQVE